MGDIAFTVREAEALAYEAQSGIIPIPIRPGLVVQVHGIPHDLTNAEAEKIARVILATSGSGAVE